jgi:hypothetical protein
MSANRDFSELVQMVRPPVPEMPTAERLARERQQIFHSHQPGQIQHATPLDSGPVERQDVCILDERGGHRKLGWRCPHFAEFDRDEVIEVKF